jgi:hypothetical protein
MLTATRPTNASVGQRGYDSVLDMVGRSHGRRIQARSSGQVKTLTLR